MNKTLNTSGVDMSSVVVFDMDKTLLSGDATKEWMLMRFKSGVIRFSLALVCAPFALLLLRTNRFKSIGASALFYVASFGMNEKELLDSFLCFASDLADGNMASIHWMNDGLHEISLHQREGRRIIIVTGSPEIFAKEIFSAKNIDVEVIGTILSKKTLGGWVGKHHCRNQEKVRRILNRGVESRWHSTYTDDIDEDYPILVNAQEKFLINSRRGKDKIGDIKYLSWK
ncbi:haloacid dehalogenase-like hydrolase (plasmid) [Klebsiella sp. WOUb02]|uniref:haloacid dehalogenase-like hydrolase n=1 Tax=Klebsiella sp. WOUb02 TaxID=3161071 RepID=UPI003CE99F47